MCQTVSVGTCQSERVSRNVSVRQCQSEHWKTRKNAEKRRGHLALLHFDPIAKVIPSPLFGPRNPFGGVAMLRSPRRSRDLRLFNFGWRHQIDHQRLVNLWWRAKRRSALLVPERTNSGTKPRNLSWGCGVRRQSLLPPTRGPMESRFAIAISRRSKRSAEHRPACACGYGSNGDGLYHMVKSHGFTTPFHRAVSLRRFIAPQIELVSFIGRMTDGSHGYRKAMLTRNSRDRIRKEREALSTHTEPRIPSSSSWEESFVASTLMHKHFRAANVQIINLISRANMDRSWKTP